MMCPFSPRRVGLVGSLLLGLSGCATPSTSGPSTTAHAQDAEGAHASTAAPLSFALVSVSGEASRDAHSTTTTWTVRGTHITRSETSAGRDAPEASADASADVASEASLRKAAYDAAARVSPDQPAPQLVDVTYRSICLQLDGHQHCAWQVGNDAPDDAYRALDSLETTLSGEVIAP